MPENTGLFQKYDVRRLDGREIRGPVFVLDLGSDATHAWFALAAYADSCKFHLPDLASSLRDLLQEMKYGQTNGPMHMALRAPRESPGLAKPLIEEELRRVHSPDPHWPKAGETWRHYKGGLYDVLAIAVHESELTPWVVYRSREKGYVWLRPVGVWLQKVKLDDGQKVPRFVKVEN